jgi:hypothetical protein
MPASLLTYCYVSRSCIPTCRADAVLSDIIAKSVERNAAAGITGALICAGAHLAQLIEGPPVAVRALRARLEADDRHEALVAVSLAPSVRRRFEGWALAYSGGSSYFARYLHQVHAGLTGPEDGERLVLMMQQFATTRRDRREGARLFTQSTSSISLS